MMRPEFILFVSLTCACTSQRTRELDLSAAVRLPDGGHVVLFDDGTVAATAEPDLEECHADAGAFLALLSDRRCESDPDCVPFRHGLAAAGLRVCYPIRITVRGSNELARERRVLARQCGFATIYSNTPCQRSVCVAQQCELAE